MSKIEDMRRSMTEAGVYSKADIDEICRLESEYEKECSEIALQCMEEGISQPRRKLRTAL